VASSQSGPGHGVPGLRTTGVKSGYDRDFGAGGCTTGVAAESVAAAVRTAPMPHRYRDSVPGAGCPGYE
jgi:hypothetical protein